MWLCTDSGGYGIFGPQHSFDDPVKLSFDIYRLVPPLEGPARLVHELDFLRYQSCHLLLPGNCIDV